MKKTLLLILLLNFTACSTISDNSNKLDIRKKCTGDEGTKTLSDIFCKK